MNASPAAMRQFRATRHERLFERVTRRELLAADESDVVVHALVDIAESIEKAYCHILPRLLSESEAATEILKDRFWDIREEFRHIDYHVQRLVEI
jgi:hypothetical protein